MKIAFDGGNTRRSRLLKPVPVLVLVLAIVLAGACSRGTPERPGAPPNEPAELSLKGDRITLVYSGRTLFEARIAAPDRGLRVKPNSFRVGEKLSQVILLEAEGGAKIGLAGKVFAGPESFPCEADRRARELVMVRHASGLGTNLLNRAVYDRGADWVLSVDAGPRVTVRPAGDGTDPRTFELEAEGGEIVLRFRPRFYQHHRGLRYFEPWTYKIWPGSIAGWISWFAFFDRVTEDDIVRTADVLSEVLLPFGYDILQIDDGYQKGEGLPELWLSANAKFPRGLAFLPQYIRSKGLRPGIWTNVAFKQRDFAEAHKDWFVTDASGRPAYGNWIQFSLDASNPQAVDAVVRPLYRGLREMGWDYFKVDALRHLRYEGYNAAADHFAGKKIGLTETYRAYVDAIRQEIGRGVFLLGCWGIRPELIGLLDGCRIGTDGFSYAGLAQFNSWNNVVWRNDPDHIELNDDRYRSTLVTSLTGSILLLTDKPDLYRTAAAEPAKRASPVLTTVPGQLFDVDPSRSGALDRLDAEVSGSGPRVFDAGLTPACDLFLLEVNRPFESWTVLGRTGESVREVRFADLGLDPAPEYYVFEFWSKRLLGSFRGSFEPGPLDPVFRSQSLVIRARSPRPQVLATSRHLTGGGVDLVDVTWKDGALAGRSRLVAGDPYDLYLTEPQGLRLDSVRCDGAAVLETAREAGLVRVRLQAGESREVVWSAGYKPFS